MIKSSTNARNVISIKVNLTEKVIEKRNECVIVNIASKTQKLDGLAWLNGEKIIQARPEQ